MVDRLAEESTATYFRRHWEGNGQEAIDCDLDNAVPFASDSRPLVRNRMHTNHLLESARQSSRKHDPGFGSGRCFSHMASKDSTSKPQLIDSLIRIPLF